MEQKEIKYYLHFSKKVEIKHEFTLNEIKFAVVDGDEGLQVARLDQLEEWEKSYQYLRQKEREEELQKLKDQEDKLVEEMQIKAFESMESRLKINAAFSDDSKMSEIGLHFARELKKILQTFDIYKIRQLNKSLEEKK